MANSAIPITAGSGTNIDTRTTTTDGDHRQVTVIGDPATDAGVAPVDATEGLKVNASALGSLTDSSETDPAAASASVASLLRGILDALGAQADTIATDGNTTDSLLAHIKLVSERIEAATQTFGTAGSPASEINTIQGIASMTPVASVGKTNIADLTPSCLTTALDDGDVLADTEVLSACFRANDTPATLQSLTVVDKDDNGGALKIFLLDVNGSLGTEGSPVSISDANADNILAVIDVETSDYSDLVGSQVAHIRNLSIPLQPASGTDDLYVAIQGGSGNTSTYTASGLVLRFGLYQD